MALESDLTDVNNTHLNEHQSKHARKIADAVEELNQLLKDARWRHHIRAQIQLKNRDRLIEGAPAEYGAVMESYEPIVVDSLPKLSND